MEFCEKSTPKIMTAEREATAFRNADRIHHSLLARAEKQALHWMAYRVPWRINSDHLTLLGFAAQLMAGISYALARWNRYWLLAVIGFLAVNWLGDSLDGTLARVRQRQRPRYGFYVDHIVDSFGALAIMTGLGASGYMHPYLAAALLIAFLLLSIQSYLATYTLGEFQISFWNFGPTELRILLAIGNLALFRWPRVLHGRLRSFDVGAVGGLVGMAVILVFFTLRNTLRLYEQERLQ
jgi:archaetidylinositol phosphate synthase